ncbi:MAG: DUF4258 domain-containing protein, partial [Treponema sp.]|nr:DUF4258 domain-containing protein [Treponema sp.]
IDSKARFLGKVGEISANAVLSGTISEIGGGKFANGAVTGAFSMMFNDMMHRDAESGVVADSKKEDFPRLPMYSEKPLEPVYPEFEVFFIGKALMNGAANCVGKMVSCALDYVCTPNLKISDHARTRISQRNFSKGDIRRIMRKGNRTLGHSKYGEKQYRYNYKGNTVIQNMKDGRIPTVFGRNDLSNPNGNKIPW